MLGCLRVIVIMKSDNHHSVSWNMGPCKIKYNSSQFSARIRAWQEVCNNVTDEQTVYLSLQKIVFLVGKNQLDLATFLQFNIIASFDNTRISAKNVSEFSLSNCMHIMDYGHTMHGYLQWNTNDFATLVYFSFSHVYWNGIDLVRTDVNHLKANQTGPVWDLTKATNFEISFAQFAFSQLRG